MIPPFSVEQTAGEITIFSVVRIGREKDLEDAIQIQDIDAISMMTIIDRQVLVTFNEK